MGERLRAVGVVLAMAFRADPRRAVLVIGLNLATALAFAIMPLWLKLLVNSAVGGELRRTVITGLAISVTLTATIFASWLVMNSSQVLQERTGLLIDERLARFALEVPGIEHYEQPEYLDRIALLRRERGLLGQSLTAIVEGLRVLLLVGTTLILLASVNPALLLLPVFGFATLVSGRKAENLRQHAMEETAEPFRRSEHLFDLATSAQAGKEIRIFGLSQELLTREQDLWYEIDRLRSRAGVWATLVDGAGWLLFVLGYGGAIGFAVWLAVRGETTVGDVLMTLALAAEVNRYVGAVQGIFGWVMSALAAVRRYLWLADYATSYRRRSEEAASVPPRLSRGIELDGVSFCYPGTDTVVLRDLTLHLPAGSAIALVGENGAGKTSLVKLLSGLYEPTAGKIIVDGTDLRSFDVYEWRRRISAGFQDFARFEFVARETTGVGDLASIENALAVMSALGRAGAPDLPATLPRGLETQLGREWEGGMDLSGGQWQKLALGRAMMRSAPLLLILDEPTASLDPQTEHDLFERYALASRDLAEHTGTITLLVSHRFSTVRMADLIVVMDGGRITEVGTHRELMARGGLYQELYELQARAYR